MDDLRDYFEAMSPPRDSRRGFSPSLGVAPAIGTPGIFDAEMWTLDTLWAPARSYVSGRPVMPLSALRPSSKAMWQSYVQCTRVAEVGGGWISQPWSVTGAAGCTNIAGVRQMPKCPWGVWRMPVCSAESIAMAWQGVRYLWAQQKMRELLAHPPSIETAAQWVWSAYQLVSVLHWSTNVNFGNPQSRLFDYRRQLEAEGCIARVAADSLIAVRNWNTSTTTVDRINPLPGPGINPPLVPVNRGDFSPSFRLPPAIAGSTALPSEVRATLAVPEQSTDLEVPTPAFFVWMRETAALDSVSVPMPSPSAGRAAYSIAIPGARGVVAEARRIMEHYVQVPFLKWQTTILTTYQLEMQPFVAALPGATQFAFARSITDFAGRAQAAQAAQWNSGEVAAYTTSAMTLIASLVNSGAGAILGLMFTLLDYLVRALGDLGLTASGFSVCPAYPFIRVPDPPCDALGPPVDVVGLPLDPPPGPVQLTAAQLATLQQRQRSGTLTPSQQALIARPLVLVSPMPMPTQKASAAPFLIGAAAIGALALLVRRR